MCCLRSGRQHDERSFYGAGNVLRNAREYESWRGFLTLLPTFSACVVWKRLTSSHV